MSRPAARPEPSGPAGERLAAERLRRDGWRIAARNLRTVHAEIDLLVRRGRLWVAVEVKARADHPAPERHVDGARLDRLERALVALAPHLRPRPRALRLDVVAVRWPRDPGEPAEVLHVAGLRTWVYDSIGARASSSAGWLPADIAGYAGETSGPAPARRRVRAWLARFLSPFARRRQVSAPAPGHPRPPCRP